MTKRTWEIELDGHKHIVELTHQSWSGKHQIWVDGDLVKKGRKFGNRFYHLFSIAGYSCELGITVENLKADYYLIVNNKFIYAQQRNADTGKSTNKFIQSLLTELAFWQDLTKITGLKYISVPEIPRPWRHRLIGKINNYLVVIRGGQNPDTQQVVVSTLIRYTTSFDKEFIQEQIKSDPMIKKLFGKQKIPKESLDVQSDFTLSVFPYQPKKEEAGQVAAKVKDLVYLLAQYTTPLSNRCGADECLAKENLQLVFINDWPELFCPDCLAEVSGIGDDIKLLYDLAPSYIGRGFFAGMIGAVLGSVLWAIITVLFNRIGTVFAVGILIGIVYIMDWVGTKRTIWSILIAAALTVMSIVLGTYLAILWHVWYELAAPLSKDVLLKVLEFMFLEDRRLLTLSLVLSLIGVIPYLWLIWYNQKRGLSHLFQPHMEIVPEFGEA